MSVCCCPPPQKVSDESATAKKTPTWTSRLGHPYAWACMTGPIAVLIAGVVTAWIAWSGADRVLPTTHQQSQQAPATIKTLNAKP